MQLTGAQALVSVTPVCSYSQSVDDTGTNITDRVWHREVMEAMSETLVVQCVMRHASCAMRHASI